MDMLPLKRAVNESGRSGGAYSIVWGVEGDGWAKENDFGLSVTKRYRKKKAPYPGQDPGYGAFLLRCMT